MCWYYITFFVSIASFLGLVCLAIAYLALAFGVFQEQAVFKLCMIDFLIFIISAIGNLCSENPIKKELDANKIETTLDTIEISTKDYIQKMKIVSFDGKSDTTFVYIKR